MPFSRKVIRGLTVSTTDSCLVFPDDLNIYIQQGQVHSQRNKIFMLYSSELAFSGVPPQREPAPASPTRQRDGVR